MLRLEKHDLEIRNKETNMSVLTSQLHPHFLFNTLNNLYLLSLEKSDKAPEIIMRLSEIMRYILDDRDKKLVNLTRELEVIKSYIEVERLRYDNHLRIDANIDLTDLEKTTILIPPLLIFTLVENAFKHGVSKSVDNPWINIEMCQKDETFNINIGNSFDECCCKKSCREGVGLKNVQRRLELYYPEKNKYSINKMRDKYIVKLEITMNNENKLFDRR
ncbi:MAG: histidine kinase [Bacteroidales bacterium]|nr:histidine kinase [Bacteroidales bacterium]